MIELFRYDGRRVVVTGCSSGIGEAVAVGAAELGATVVGVDIKPPASDIAEFVHMDLGDRRSIDAGAAAIGGTIDALFNCAGLSDGSATPSQVFAVNFLGMRHLTEALVGGPLAGGGAVVNVASLGGLGWDNNLEAVQQMVALNDWDTAESWCAAHPEQFARGGYGFSKQSMILYTKERAVPWAQRGLRVNVIGPSPVDTPMLAASVKSVGQAFLDAFPRSLGRNSTAQEQAAVLLFLNSGAASYVTGQLLWTDGGYTAGLTTGQIDRPGSGRA